MSRAADRRGFSLVEMAMVVAIVSGLSAVLYSAFAVQNATAIREGGNTLAENDARGALDRMVRELQTAGFDPRGSGSFKFGVTEASEVRFTTDANQDGILQAGAAENRGFALSGGVLRTWLGGRSWRTLASGVESLEFAYLDARGQPTSYEPAIRAVTVSIGVRSAGKSPGATAALRTLTGTAILRNR